MRGPCLLERSPQHGRRAAREGTRPPLTAAAAQHQSKGVRRTANLLNAAPAAAQGSRAPPSITNSALVGPAPITRAGRVQWRGRLHWA